MTVSTADAAPVKRHILIAEDSATTSKQLKHLLESDLGVVADTAADGDQALEALVGRPYSVLLTDLKMPRRDGIQLIEEIQKRRLPVTVIVTTGHGSIDEAVHAMRLGAYDFITKPVDLDYLRLVLRRALHERALQEEVDSLRERLQERYSFHDILSKSPRMREVFELIGHVARTNTTVLINGQTGTGKELVARAIHQASPRHDGPLIAINCAAVPETLLESELFGHEKGSFTSAISQRKGRFELAHGGTLFLDEVGDVPAAMQAKLLRVLQERCFERVGGTDTIEVDVRVIAATNRSLQKMVEEGKFRQDLYYRLNVVKIDLPPLRERAEDIPLLATHFAAKYSRPGTAPKHFAPEAMEALLRYRWPGNNRELENAVERACVTSRDDTIHVENLPPDVIKPPDEDAPFPIDLSRPLGEQVPEVTAAFEESYLRRALREAGGDVEEAARTAGLSARALQGKMEQYDLEAAEFAVR